MMVESGLMARRKEYTERKQLTLPDGTLARIEAVRRGGEDAMDVIRTALFKELGHREDIEAEVERRLKERLKD